MNAYTRLLQHQVEADISESVVVNAIHPGSRHSKISQESPLTPSDAAKVKHCLYIHKKKETLNVRYLLPLLQSVICVALLADPCSHPRGKFIWHDLQIIEWDQGSLKGMWA